MLRSLPVRLIKIFAMSVIKLCGATLFANTAIDAQWLGRSLSRVFPISKLNAIDRNRHVIDGASRSRARQVGRTV